MTLAYELAKKIISQALIIEQKDVNEKTQLGITTQWDSLAHMRLVLAIEEEIGHQLDPEAIISLGCFTDVINLLDKQSS